MANSLTDLIVYLLAVLSFFCVAMNIGAFSSSITTPIEKLTQHTIEYKKAKSRQEKRDVIAALQGSEMFARIKKIKRREEVEELLIKIEENKEAFERKISINRHTDVQQKTLRKSKTKTYQEKKKELISELKKLKNEDPRLIDEIDELKHIFYLFFVETGQSSNEQNKNGTINQMSNTLNQTTAEDSKQKVYET